MNNQISRRNLIKLLGVSSISLPLTGFTKPLEKTILKNTDKNSPIKLSSNENPYGPSPKVRNAIIDAFDEACRYPYSRVAELEAMIAKKEGDIS